jgi:hypothetical protein
MNQRDANPGSDYGERGRNTNGSRDLYPGSHGFEDTTHRTYGGRGPSEREGSSAQGPNPPGQYERDTYAQRQHRPGQYGSDHYGGQYDPRQGGSSQHSEPGAGRYGSSEHGPREQWNSGFGQRYDQGRQESERYDYGGGQGSGGGYGGGADELGYGGGEGRYTQEHRYTQRPYEQQGTGFGFRQRGPRADEQGARPYGWEDQYRARRYSQPQYRPYAGYFPRDQYGQEHSSEQLFGREPFRRDDEPRYFGTGAAGRGGPGFTGGAYAYGDGPPDRPRLQDTEYSDESALSYGRGYRRGYGGGGSGGYGRPGAPRNRPFPPGPKGYQRSDERLNEDISERLMEAVHIDSSEVTVEVRDAKVVLEGVVPDRRMKHAIEDLVDACPGVQDIDNRVRVGSASVQPVRTVGMTSTGMGTGGATAAPVVAGSAASTTTPSKSK